MTLIPTSDTSTATAPIFAFEDNDRWRVDSAQQLMERVVNIEGLTTDGDVSRLRLSVISHNNAQYADALNKAFDFLRENVSNYSTRTLMSIRRTAQRANSMTIEERSIAAHDMPEGWPSVFVFESAFEYDADTEVKRGGPIGFLVVMPEDEGGAKGVIGVREQMRRNKVGTMLLRAADHLDARALKFFVKNRNHSGIAFAASARYAPVQINSQTQVVQLERLD